VTPVWLALAAALLLQGHPAGIGVAALAVALVAGAPRRPYTWLAVALALVPAVRAAGWLQWMCLAGAFLYAGGGPRAIAGLPPGPFLVLGRMDVRWRTALPAARGVALAAALLVPFAVLFGTADAAFAEWLEGAGEAVPELDDSLLARFGLAFAVLAMAGALAIGPGKPLGAGSPRIGRTEWLMAVGALTLAVLGAARRWTEGDRLQVLLLGGLCVLTLVVLGSAWHRLGLYVEAFGLTRLRVLAEWGILALGGAFLLVVARRPQRLVAYAGVALLAFALSNPEGRIAGDTTAEVRRTLSEDAGDCRGERAPVSLNLARLSCR
jgi:hypothetical protein